MWLRRLTADLNLGLDSLFGVHWIRIAADEASYHGSRYRYTIACTMADAWCGALPLVWIIGRRLRDNLAWIAALTAAMFALNVIRLSASDLLFSRGMPWTLAHGGVAVLAYLAIWQVIRRRQAWRKPAQVEGSANPAETREKSHPRPSAAHLSN